MFSDFLNLFLFDTKHELGTVIKALQTKGLFQSLAEPNLVAESGKEASFLAGGEFPVPIAQGSGDSVAITVQYKEFGIRLNFTPTVIGNRVHLKVRPEVSTLDFANGVVLQGFRIPALSTRRTETELELQDGQTFAIAGLMNNTMNSTLQKIPGIGDIPILGLLFKSKAAQKNQTELVVMITPQILPRTSNGVTPTCRGRPSSSCRRCRTKKLIQPLPPAFTPSASGGSRRTSGSDAAAAAPRQPGREHVDDERRGIGDRRSGQGGHRAADRQCRAGRQPQPAPAAPTTPSSRRSGADDGVRQEGAGEGAGSRRRPSRRSRPSWTKRTEERQAKLAKAQEKAEQERQASSHWAEGRSRTAAKRDADAARKQQK